MRPKKRAGGETEWKEVTGEMETGDKRVGRGGISQDSAPGYRQDHSLPTHLYKMLCRMEAKGVMPMPAPMSTACSEAKILRAGVP